jgi:hypothetical protein
MLFQEEDRAYAGNMAVAQPHAYRLDPVTGRIETAAVTAAGLLPVALRPREAALFLLADAPLEASVPALPSAEPLELDRVLVAAPRFRVVAVEHDFEIRKPEEATVPFAGSRPWRAWLGEDFSGEVEYRAEFELPESWEGAPLRLETGPVEYAATVFLDGRLVGRLLWPPWELPLPDGCSAGRHELVIRVANTLANELTSKRVVADWAGRTGPGWPSVYHERAFAFERESRGGGLDGPVLLRKMRKA